MKKILQYLLNSCYNKDGKDRENEGVLKNMKGKYSALDIAKYLICNYSNDENTITQLKLQKLLYFIEAYYMSVYDSSELFKEEFYAWTYGPVIKEVYDKYKIFMSEPIVEESCENIIDLPKEVTESIEMVEYAFGKLPVHDLIKITHRDGSPWSNTERKGVISKSETKKWFTDLFLNGKKNEG